MGFLENTARQIWEHHGKEVSDHMFLFPSRRAMLYFKRAITSVAAQTLWMPECLTLESWIKDQSDLVLVDAITSAYNLYLSAVSVGFTQDDFETFYPLARIILNDFEEVDLELIETGILWKHASAWQGVVDQESPPNIWSEMTDTELKQRWMVNWNKLDNLYNEFVKRLRDEDQATKGMIYREISGLVHQIPIPQFPKIHVIGFSFLTKAEVSVLEYFKSEFSTGFYWNILPELLQPAMDAGENVAKWADHFGQDLRNVPTCQPDVEVLSTPGMVPQVKALSQILCDATGNEDKMAVLLPHPSLIDIFLSSFPDNRLKVNISLGYPLFYSNARPFIEWVLTLWENAIGNGGRMDRSDLERIWSHLYVTHYIKRKNIVLPNPGKLYYTLKDLKGENFGLALLYQPLTSFQTALERLIALLEELTPYQPDVFHREVLRYVAGRLVRLSDVLSRFGKVSMTFLKRIIVEIMQTASVPFRGEPMEGVQVLGVQEIQNLAFDTLIIPGMNEEILPSGKLKSLIPFSLRRYYGLDLNGRHTVQSYYIWSAILQASKIYLLHSQADDMLGAKGLSRYIYQLKYGSERIYPIEKYLELGLNGFDTQAKEIVMDKSQETVLYSYLQEKGLSPTSLMSYITCPFQFFLSYVLGIREDDVVEAGLDYRKMGTVIHDLMEDLYQPFLDKELTSDDIKQIKSGIDDAVQYLYQKLYPHDAPETLQEGQHWIEQMIISRAVRRFLEYDSHLEGLKIFLLEAELEQTISTDYIQNVKLKGKIDRLDQKENVYRIIDYKTGTSRLNKYSLTKLWDERNPAHNWQILFYAYLVKDKLGSSPFEAGHYTLKDKNLYIPLTYKSKSVHSMDELTEFEDILKEVIDEMVNPDIPFTQTDKLTYCKYCVFNTFCERQG